MRKRTQSGVLLLAFCLGALPAMGRVDVDQFPYQKDLRRPEGATGKVASCVLDSDIYAATDLRYANLRIIDDNDAEVPFLIRKKVGTAMQLVESVVSSEIISFSQLEDNRVRVVVEKQEGEGVPTIIDLHTRQTDYEKLASVYGSDNQKRWKELVSDQPIFDYSRYVDVRNSRIRIPPRRYRYYRIEIANFTEKRPARDVVLTTQRRGDAIFSEVERKTMREEHIHIDRIELRETKQVQRKEHPARREYACGDLEVATDQKEQRTIVSFRTQREPVVSVSLETGSENFSRQSVIQVDAGEGRPKWRQVASGRLYRLDLGNTRREGLTLTLGSPSRHERYRITLHNQDNAPLDVSGIVVTGEVYEAVFFPAPVGHYRILYGGEGIGLPRYDVDSVLGSVAAVDMDPWELRDEQPNSLYKPGSRWGGVKMRPVFIVAMGLMTVLLVFLIAKGAAKLEEPQ